MKVLEQAELIKSNCSATVVQLGLDLLRSQKMRWSVVQTAPETQVAQNQELQT